MCVLPVCLVSTRARRVFVSLELEPPAIVDHLVDAGKNLGEELALFCWATSKFYNMVHCPGFPILGFQEKFNL